MYSIIRDWQSLLLISWESIICGKWTWSVTRITRFLPSPCGCQSPPPGPSFLPLFKSLIPWMLLRHIDTWGNFSHFFAHAPFLPGRQHPPPSSQLPVSRFHFFINNFSETLPETHPGQHLCLCLCHFAFQDCPPPPPMCLVLPWRPSSTLTSSMKLQSIPVLGHRFDLNWQLPWTGLGPCFIGFKEWVLSAKSGKGKGMICVASNSVPPWGPITLTRNQSGGTYLLLCILITF